MIEITRTRHLGSPPLTAVLLIGPASDGWYPTLPTHLVALTENFRPLWSVTPLDGTPSSPMRRVASLTAPLADGLLTWAAAAAPALLASDQVLDHHARRSAASVGSHSRLTRACGDRIFAALAGKLTVWLALFDGALVTLEEVDRARAAGLAVDLASPGAQVAGRL